MTSFYSEVVPFIRIRPLFREPSIQNPFEIPADSASQNESRSNTARNSLPPFIRILPPYKSIFDQLLQRYGNEGVGGRGEFDYIAATAYSPLHRGVGQQTPAWIITHLGVEGEGKVPECMKLEPGTTIWLYDQGLSERDFGFERVWLFGKIGEVYCREPGYHLYRLTPHLFTITEDPIPVHISAPLIAIPSHLLPESYHIDRLREGTLGQRVIHGFSCIQPPLRPWEMDRNWTHPLGIRIGQWHAGLLPDLEREWSEFHNKD